MKPKAIVRIGIDIGMTVLLLSLMAYELIGSGLHEWIGLAMFVLFVCHHLLNRGWYKNLFRGSYTPMHLLQTILAGLVLLTMLGAMVSSVLISREVFAFLPISGGRSLGRTLHLLCAYWGFVLLSLHLGIHCRSMMAMAGRLCKPSPTRRRVLQVAGALAALYGLYAFFHRSIPTYLFLQSQFVFFDFEEPLIFFFLDYLAAMGRLDRPPACQSDAGAAKALRTTIASPLILDTHTKKDAPFLRRILFSQSNGERVKIPHLSLRTFSQGPGERVESVQLPHNKIFLCPHP